MRALKLLVAVMSVLIVGATVALVYMLVQRMGGAVSAGSPVPPGGLTLGQPAGTRINQVAGAEGRVVVWVTRPDGERLVFVDVRSGRVLGEMRVGE